METIKTGFPHRQGETFALAIDDIEVDLKSNMRKVKADDLRELAESMRRSSGIGQVQPILVAWTGEHYTLVAGFRRLMAMRTFRKEMGFKHIIAWRVPLKDADLVRLAENAARKSPSSFETARYVYQMATGSTGRKKLHSRKIGAVIGKSSSYVRILVRLYRSLSPVIRDLWRADEDGRFTFARLNKLVQLGQAGDEVAAQALLAKMFATASEQPPPSGRSPRPLIEPRGPRGLGRKRVRMLIARLEEDAALVQEDEVAKVAHTLLRGMAGLESVETCVELVEQVRAGRSIAAPALLVATPPLQIAPSPSRPQTAAT